MHFFITANCESPIEIYITETCLVIPDSMYIVELCIDVLFVRIISYLNFNESMNIYRSNMSTYTSRKRR